MILGFIFGVSILQIAVYFLSDQYKLRFLKAVFFIMLLICNLFFFPKYFLSQLSNEGGVNCGIPQMAIFMGFWFIGNGALLVVHFSYYLIKKFAFRKEI